MSYSTGRRAYLDWVRGVAVLIMIEAHVLDSWTRSADRTRQAFGHAMVLAGFGAPLFLFLAGVAAVLSAQSKFTRHGDYAAAWRAVERRGWQIFGLAFLFRLQSFVLGGFTNAAGILKVDILNVMGPSIALVAIVGRTTGKKAVLGVGFAAVALGMGFLTPVVRVTPLLEWLPDPLEWYFRPVPGRTNFTLFPWAGFVLAGAAVGLAVAANRPYLQLKLAAAGATLALVAYQASFLPSIYERSDFWTSSPAFFLLRVGVLTSLLPIGYAWEHAPWRHKLSSWSPLEELGRASLFVYWIHVEMVYGFLSRPLRRALSLEAALAAIVVFTLFLLALVRLKNRATGEGIGIYLTDSKSVI